MLRDDRSSGEGRRSAPRNVFGEPIEPCSLHPLTGFYRDGCCNTGLDDVGSHTVCVVMTAEFLDFSKARGNDLSTPMPKFGFRRPQAGRPLVPVRAALAGGFRGRPSAARRPARHP